MDFACVNCSKLTAVSFTSNDLTVYRCASCDMEYQLITGCRGKSTTHVSIEDNKVIAERDKFNAMPIKVEIKQQ